MENSSFAAFDEHGPPDVFYVARENLEPIGANEIRVEMRAAGVNAYDIKQRAGFSGSATPSPRTRTGYDGSGVITQVGASVQDWFEGERVLVRNKLGTTATRMTVRARNLLRLPENVSHETAAAMSTPLGVAYQALKSLNVGPGDVLLIHGGSGGVGLAAVQFARLMGANRVIATSSPRGFSQIKGFGAEPIRYGPGLGARLDETLGSDSISVILDMSGTQEAIDTHTRLSDSRRWATVAGGSAADAIGLRAFGGTSLRKLDADELNLRREGIEEGLRLLSVGEISARIGAKFALRDIAAAHASYEQGAVSGRIVLDPTQE